HSLLATRIIARTNHTLNSSLTLKDIFDYPTITGLADLIDGTNALTGATGTADDMQDTLPVLRVTDVTRPDVIPASYGQQALWLIDQTGA
ncbi:MULTISPECIES: phosphopantetheine-binding protein, partial [Corynebacterium]|uniref:phosphopantetheine-binding protein n=1 Tax=Corynebacterium TaxID=1716 RepID=UPI003FCFFB4F